MTRATVAPFLLVAATLGCSSSSASGSSTDASTDGNADVSYNADIVCHVEGADAGDAGACGTTVTSCVIPDGDHQHLSQGTFIPYPTNPPCGGDHYPIWIEWGVHTTPVPVGNWVHNLEHGGVVFLYRCASHDACPTLAAQVEALAAAVPEDPVCAADGEGVHARVLVIPDPDLPAGVQVAAAAWGFALTATCFDQPTLLQFYDDHFGKGSEDICFQGAPVP